MTMTETPRPPTIRAHWPTWALLVAVIVAGLAGGIVATRAAAAVIGVAPTHQVSVNASGEGHYALLARPGQPAENVTGQIELSLTGPAAVTVVSRGAGDVSCEITVDGRTADANRASGGVAICVAAI